MKEIEYSKIRTSIFLHTFFGNFDQGVIFIFLSFYIWGKTESMLTVALAFIIPAVVNTIIDYYFSSLSDKKNRVLFIIVGNIGSAVFLSCYGLVEEIFVLYIFIFFKSLFAKIYNSSLLPYRREVIPEEKFKDFLSKENMLGSIGASVGGFSLMFLFIFTKNMSLIFIISGLIELFSTVFLFFLRNSKQTLRKEIEDSIDIEMINKLTLIYTMEAFGIALLVNRFIIFLSDVHSFSIENVGIVFFIVFGMSNLAAASIYQFFKKIQFKNMLIFTFSFQALLLVLLMNIPNISIVILLWFIFELASNISTIYSDDHVNKSLFTNIGKRLSKFRISISIASILGQLIISLIWDKFGIGMSFYFSAIILFVLAFTIIFSKIKQEVISKKISGV